jgi:hypothetical protein
MEVRQAASFLNISSAAWGRNRDSLTSLLMHGYIISTYQGEEGDIFPSR